MALLITASMPFPSRANSPATYRSAAWFDTSAVYAHARPPVERICSSRGGNALRVNIHESNSRTESCQPDGHRKPQAARGTGDQNGLLGKLRNS
jgi:hypothetical protein